MGVNTEAAHVDKKGAEMRTSEDPPFGSPVERYPARQQGPDYEQIIKAVGDGIKDGLGKADSDANVTVNVIIATASSNGDIYVGDEALRHNGRAGGGR